MKVQIKSWTPSNANFTRFYVTNAETAERIGYIQTNHSAKGMYNVDSVDSAQLVGDKAVLAQITDLAQNSLTSKGLSDFESLDIQLHRLTVNQYTHGVKPYGVTSKEFAKRKKEAANRVWEVQA